jgi:hypothetical protein
MISSSYNFSGFFEALDAEDRDYLDIIYLAEQEATEVERMLYNPKSLTKIPFHEVENYAKTVKNFISFMRYGVKPVGVDNADFDLFRSVCMKLAEKGRLQGRCSDLI